MMARQPRMAITHALFAASLVAQQSNPAPPRIAVERVIPWSETSLDDPQGYRTRGHFDALFVSTDGTRLTSHRGGSLELASGRPAGPVEYPIGPASEAQFFVWNEQRGSHANAVLILDGGSFARDVAPEAWHRIAAWRRGAHAEFVTAPSGKFLIRHGATGPADTRRITRLHLPTGQLVHLQVATNQLTALAWSSDERRLAIAMTRNDAAVGIEVFDDAGTRLASAPADDATPITALAFDRDDRSVVWGGAHLHRLDLRTGAHTAWGEGRMQWVRPIGEHHVLGHDGTHFHWFAANTLRTVATVPAGLPAPERTRSWQDTLRATVATVQGEWLVIAAQDGLHRYRLLR